MEKKKLGFRIESGTPLRLRSRLGGELRRERRRRPFLTLFPNGQFSLSYKYRTSDIEAKEEDEWRFLRGVGYQRPTAERAPNLVSTQQSSQPTPHGEGRKSRKYGLKGITRFGSKMVRSGAYILQRDYGRRDLTFLTITVPALSRDERVAIAQRWGELMRQTIQYLSRQLRRSGQQELIVSVTELQSARLHRYGQAYLHAHLVFPARVKGSRSWAVPVGDFRTWWKSAIERVIGRELDLLPRVEAKTIRKSAEGYLGKYMTKGSESMQGIVDDLGEDSVPGQQWNMSGPLRQKVKSETVNGFDYGFMVQARLDLMVQGLEKIGAYLRRIEIDIGGRIITTAWVGLIARKDREAWGLP